MFGLTHNDLWCPQVGGSVTGNTFQRRLHIFPETEGGFCVKRLGGSYHKVPGFPRCVITDLVVNFFMAKTERVRAVGFDPRLSRIAHTGTTQPTIHLVYDW